MAAFAKSCPDSLKPLVLQYLQRAGEFAVRNPTVGYYCKKYAVELAAANRPADDPSVMPWLLSLMDDLEATRASVTQDTDEARDTINTVALTLFAKADAQERTNNVDKTTVQIFRVASVLMTVTEQFGDLDADIAEKRKYARWKAAAIKRCLDQGVPYQREPDTQEDLDDLDELSGGAPAGGYDPFASTVPSTSFTSHSTPQPTPVAPPAASPYSAPAPVHHQPAATYHAPTNANFEPSFESQQEAIKCAKYIISALQFNDFTTARTNARKALELLEGHATAPTRR